MLEIICQRCGGSNQENAKFCIGCGGKLSLLCAACGGDNPSHARFCAQCGTALSALPTHAVAAAYTSDLVPTLAPPRLPAASPALTERRHITVLFCDLVGSTSLSEHLDPEDLHALISAYQDACGEAVRRHDGYIAKYLGDGMMVFFGYPRSHEDAAHRALRAGLEMIEAVKRLAERARAQWNVPLAARIGVHTGLVVAGEMGAEERRAMDIVGETPNIAARLQEVAAPNTVVLSAATRRLTAEAFTLRPLGERALKGLSRPLEIYQAIAEAEAVGVAQENVGALPLIGRERERRHLLERWQQSRSGSSQFVLLSGEAGIGKSRLMRELHTQAASQDDSFITVMKCSPYHQSSAFHPIIQALQNDVMKFKREDTPEDRWRKLNAFLTERRFIPTETAPLLAALLALPADSAYPAPNLSAEGSRQKTLAILLQIVLKRAERQPYLLILENIHWADPSTLELIQQIAEQIQRGFEGRLLLLLTFRPSFAPAYPLHPNLLSLSLERLDDSHVKNMVQRVAGTRELPADVVQQIIAKTDGVPLFVEELTKMVLETGVLEPRAEDPALPGPRRELEVPATLNDSLMARLDRLSTVKEIAQIASVIGREFTCELLQAVSEQDDLTLKSDLQRLVTAEMLYERRDVDGGLVYRFKHALIQDAAYQSLLISRRQQYHRRIAEALSARFPDMREQQPELLAGHYMAAGQIESALIYWNRAGQRALARSANQEAIIHFSKALELLESHPDTPDALQQELYARASLGMALISTQGFAAPNVGKVFARAQELCDLCGNSPEIVPVLLGFSGFYLVGADFARAKAEAEHLLELAAQWDHHGLHVIGRYSLGNPLLWLGHLEEARSTLEQALHLYDPANHSHYTAIYTQDPGVSVLCFLELLLWHQGYPDQAVRRGEEAIALAIQNSHLFSQAWALNCAALVAYWRRDAQSAARIGEESVAHSATQGYPFFLSASMMYRGWGIFQQGQRDEGLAQIRQGLAIYQATGSRVCQPFLLGLLAETLYEMGETGEGLAVVEQGLVFARQTGERLSEPGLHRLKGSLLLAQSPDNAAAAEASFRLAIEIARDMGARSRELQATTALCKMLRQQGRGEEARPHLAALLAWFTEGFDTPDYQEAAALLMEMKEGGDE